MNANTKSVKLPITDEVAAGVDCIDYRGWRAVARKLERELIATRKRAERAEAELAALRERLAQPEQEPVGVYLQLDLCEVMKRAIVKDSE